MRIEDLEVKAQPEVLYASDGVVRRSAGTTFDPEEGMTRQDQAPQADIHTMVSSMMAGGLPGMRVPQYADISDVKCLHESLEDVRRATLAFAAMPPHVRNAFDQDMVRFTEAFQSEEGRAKLKGLGVIPLSEDELADRREQAIEDRAAKRVVERERQRRVREAEKDPPLFADAPKGASS